MDDAAPLYHVHLGLHTKIRSLVGSYKKLWLTLLKTKYKLDECRNEKCIITKSYTSSIKAYLKNMKELWN